MSDNLEKTVADLILVLDGKLLPYIEKLTVIHSQLIETSSLDPEVTIQVLSGFDENINPLLIDLRNLTNQLTTIKSRVAKMVAHPEETKEFFKTMDQLLAAGVIQDHGNKENGILIHMASVLPEISATAGRNFDVNILYFQLRKSDRFIQQQNLKRSCVTNKPLHTWAFKKMHEPGTTGKDQLTGADTFKAGGDE